MKSYKKIYIEITNNCNLSCSFCTKSNKPKRNMTLDEFELILNKIKGHTKSVYLHVKGEPLLHKDIITMLELCEKYQVRVNLTTNGVLFKKLVNELNKCKALKKINFSLHSENNIPHYLEEIFDSVEKLNSNITVIYRLWTLNNGNFDEKSTKIVNKIINHYNLPQKTVEKLYNENNIKISSTIYVDKDNEFSWPKINNENHTGYCHGLTTQMAILVDGTVVPCCLDSEGIVKLGNIYEDNLEDIIRSNRFQNLKKSFQDRKPCEELCKSCTFKR